MHDVRGQRGGDAEAEQPAARGLAAAGEVEQHRGDEDQAVDGHRLQEINIRWRGSFGYVDAWADECDDSDERIPLCRIEYPGDDEDWGSAVYDPATQRYTDAVLHTGYYTDHPGDAYGTAAIIHPTDYQK